MNIKVNEISRLLQLSQPISIDVFTFSLTLCDKACVCLCVVRDNNKSAVMGKDPGGEDAASYCAACVW